MDHARAMNGRAARSVLIALALALWVCTAHGQQAAPLVPYVNDTLGFSIHLPCTPVAVPRDVGRGGAMLGCKGNDPVIAISVEERTPVRDRDLDDVVRKEFQVDGPVTIERVRVHGRKARIVGFGTDAFRTRSLVLMHRGRMYLVILMQRNASTHPLDDGILRSFRLLR